MTTHHTDVKKPASDGQVIDAKKEVGVARRKESVPTKPGCRMLGHDIDNLRDFGKPYPDRWLLSYIKGRVGVVSFCQQYPNEGQYQCARESAYHTESSEVYLLGLRATLIDALRV